MLSRSNTISEGTEFKLVDVDEEDDDKTGLILPRFLKATVPKRVEKNARERSTEQFMVIIVWKKKERVDGVEEQWRGDVVCRW